LDLASHCRHQSPSDNEEPKVPRGASTIVQSEVARQLSKDIRTKEERETDLILVSYKTEILFETLQTSGCIVVTVSL
jgi:hypothetical protein